VPGQVQAAHDLLPFGVDLQQVAGEFTGDDEVAAGLMK
jgi:hypothetical protein